MLRSMLYFIASSSNASRDPKWWATRPWVTPAYSQGLRWCALAGGSWQLMFEACVTYKINGGTRALIEAMLEDARVEVRFNAPARRIVQGDDHATVLLEDGTSLTAGAVVVTLPLNILNTVEFDPPLPPASREAAAAGQTSTGIKVWARVRGRLGPFVALAPEHSDLTLAHLEYAGEEDSIIAAFGADASRLDVTDREAVQSALRAWIPDLTVLEVAGHDWAKDPHAGETWPMLRVGQLTSALAELQAPHGRVVMAGSDYASGWAGFIDGAIESGMRAARLCSSILLRPVSSGRRTSASTCRRR